MNGEVMLVDAFLDAAHDIFNGIKLICRCEPSDARCCPPHEPKR
jgi:hypothetical protein